MPLTECGDNSAAATLHDRALTAIIERQKHREAYLEFHTALGRSVTKPWQEMVEAWEADQDQPNPFEVPEHGTRP